ncbi:hypothetical protein Salat_2434100 [Sesamum alatum]|uniref:Uncharacterized protein n=1 Tax=Sesamum alatum TaxID=300844 RepID=A0AAE1XZ17_9LAMI|nr:hypothetical protein Salat_2434100 [Sesamum alatum]
MRVERDAELLAASLRIVSCKCCTTCCERPLASDSPGMKAVTFVTFCGKVRLVDGVAGHELEGKKTCCSRMGSAQGKTVYQQVGRTVDTCWCHGTGLNDRHIIKVVGRKRNVG